MAPSDYRALSVAPHALRLEFVRKALHLLAATLPLAYRAGASRGSLIAVLAVATAIALVIEAARRASARFGATFARAFGTLTRAHEAGGITGATWLALSCLIAVAALSRNAAIAALWCATVGDPVATIVGRSWAALRARNESARAGKSAAGSFACLAVSLMGVWLLAGYSPAIASAVAVAATIAEALPSRLDDNLRVTLAAGVVAQLLA
jgi:dolichol kinase